MAVLTRTLQLIEGVAGHSEGVGVNKLSAELAEPPASVHRMLSALRNHGVVLQDPTTKQYRLGPATLRWAQAFLRQDTMASVAQPLLERIRSDVDESIFLTELVGGNAICVATAESTRPLRFFMSVGQRMPWHAAASARAILAHLPENEAQQLLKAERMQRYTTATPVSATTVMKGLRSVRTKGFASCEEELEVGVAALAVPVRGRGGEVRASLSVVAPARRLTSEIRPALVKKLTRTAAEITERLGHSLLTPAANG